MQSPTTRLIATAAGSIGIALWASETALITFTARLPPMQTVALAFMVAAALGPAVWWFTGDSPRAAFKHRPLVWLVTVGSLVGFHACIYYAVQNAPAAPAALLQGTTPLMIVLGSALLPGERLRWWHVAGAIIGLIGVISLIDTGEQTSGTTEHAGFYLALVGAAAAIWGLFSLLSRSFANVPTSAMGIFFFSSALVAGLAHLSWEEWVTPSFEEWAAIAALGVLPMGLALYLWDFGLKKGDLQALGGISYFEPFLGALFVAAIGQGMLTLNMLWSGALIIAGAGLASLNVWNAGQALAGGPVAEPHTARFEAHNQFQTAARALDRFHAQLQKQSALPPRQCTDLDRRIAQLSERVAELTHRVAPADLDPGDAELLKEIAAELLEFLNSLKDGPAASLESVARRGVPIEQSSCRDSYPVAA